MKKTQSYYSACVISGEQSNGRGLLNSYKYSRVCGHKHDSMRQALACADGLGSEWVVQIMSEEIDG